MRNECESPFASRSFRVEIACDLTTAEVWPDGGAPENPTAEDVALVMREYGAQSKVVRDWSLADYGGVTVDGIRVW